jgi:hypothetical protein
MDKLICPMVEMKPRGRCGKTTTFAAPRFSDSLMDDLIGSPDETATGTSAGKWRFCCSLAETMGPQLGGGTSE